MSARSAHDLMRTRLCEDPGCGDDAEGWSTLCARHARIAGVSRAPDWIPPPTSPPTSKPLDAASSVLPPQHRIEGRLCRVASCVLPATHGIGSSGRWANLCDEHHLAERERASAQAVGRKPKPKAKAQAAPRAPDPPPSADGTRAQIAAEISEVADALDVLDAEREALRERERPLVQRWSDLCREMARYDGGPA